MTVSIKETGQNRQTWCWQKGCLCQIIWEVTEAYFILVEMHSWCWQGQVPAEQGEAVCHWCTSFAIGAGSGRISDVLKSFLTAFGFPVPSPLLFWHLYTLVFWTASLSLLSFHKAFSILTLNLCQRGLIFTLLLSESRL